MLKSAWKSALNLAVTEPAMIMTATQTALALITSLGLTLSAGKTGTVLAFTSAVLTAVPAFLARPVKVSGLTGLVSAGVTLLLAFGVHGIQPGLVATLNAAIVAVMAIVLRGHLTPVANQPQPAPAPVPAAPVPPAAG